MFDAPVEDEEPRPSLIRRWLAEPIRLRQRARVLLLIAVLLAGPSRLLDGWSEGFLTALLWIGVLPLAIGIAAGDAFLVTYGRGQRRLIATLLGAVLLALLSCILLASIAGNSGSTGRDIVGIVAYSVFYAANVLGLSALIALAIGRGGDYVSRRIDVMGEEDW
jgi:hypothetical protein